MFLQVFGQIPDFFLSVGGFLLMVIHCLTVYLVQGRKITLRFGIYPEAARTTLTLIAILIPIWVGLFAYTIWATNIAWMGLIGIVITLAVVSGFIMWMMRLNDSPETAFYQP